MVSKAVRDNKKMLTNVDHKITVYLVMRRVDTVVMSKYNST